MGSRVQNEVENEVATKITVKAERDGRGSDSCRRRYDGRIVTDKPVTLSFCVFVIIFTFSFLPTFCFHLNYKFDRGRCE